MKRFLAALLALLLMLPVFSAGASSAKPPRLHLFTLAVGDTTEAVEASGTWQSQHSEVATISANGVITAHKPGYTLVLNTNHKGDVLVRCEVWVGEVPVPAQIQQVIDLAIQDWAEAGGEAFPKYTLYTQWFNPGAKNGFGWCGAFIGYQFDEAGVEMNPEYRPKSAPPLADGALFAVRQASQTKLFEGFRSRNRLSSIPKPGYYVVYGRRGSTPYTHVGLVTAVQDMGEGKYLLETVEGNLNARIKRYSYVYDSLAERKERNISPIPEGLQTQPEVFNYTYVKEFYLNVFGQTWY